MKTMLIAVIAAVVLLGGSAAAYFGVVVPNQPENQLKQAIQNTIDGKNPAKATKGKISFSSADASGSLDINMLYADAAQGKGLADMKLTMSGVEIPLEVRYLDGDAYMKAGDLSTLSALLTASSGVDAAQAKAVISKISNQWIKIDKTLLAQTQKSATQQSTAACSSEELSARSREAMNEWLGLATEDGNEVYTITSTSADTTDGVATTKFELSMDKAKLMEFGKQAQDLPSTKELEKCLGDSSSSSASEAEDNSDITKFNVWIDGDKNFKRIELGAKTTEGTASETTMDFTLVTDTPNVEAPTDAKPFMQVVGEIQKILYGSSTPTSLNSLSL